MTSSPTALLPRRLSLRRSPLTSWVLAPEAWRDPCRATIPQMTKGSRTWSPMQTPPVLSRAYPAPCNLSRGRRMEGAPAPPSPWPATPATVLLCRTRARRWEKPRSGRGTGTGQAGLNSISIQSIQEMNRKANFLEWKVLFKFLWRIYFTDFFFFNHALVFNSFTESMDLRWNPVYGRNTQGGEREVEIGMACWKKIK